ncbi:MAG: PaaI family thioesterase [bacterium]
MDSFDAVPTPTSGTLPWTRRCFVCGESNPHGLRQHSRIEGEWIVMDYTPREADLGYKSTVHGGITMTILDEVMTWAAIVAAHRGCVTAEITVRLRTPIVVGEALRFAGRVASAKRLLLRTEAQVTRKDGAIAATATGLYTPMNGAQLEFNATDFVTHPDALDPRILFG